MKEDVLEQLVDDYLQTKGYFTRHNIKFRPHSGHKDYEKNKDSNHSDIDVIGFNPRAEEPTDRVWVVTCKSWQSGFRVRAMLDALREKKIVGGREAWRYFRELSSPKWTEAFFDAVSDVSGSRQFTYVTAVTFVVGERTAWEHQPEFLLALDGNPIRMIDLPEMLAHIRRTSTTTVAPSAIGRVVQLMAAAEKSKAALREAVESQGDAPEDLNQ